jgi:L-iditol 2-dehydrogenase
MATAPARSAFMRQAVIAAPDRLELVEAPVPRLRDDGEVLVRTAASGICSGDLMPWYLAKKVGSVLGHEVVGRAVEVGSAAGHIRAGDLVFLHHHAPCGSCPACARGTPVHCPEWRVSAIDPGGMAEWIRVPAGNVRGDTFAVNDLAAEQAVFIEPLGCSVKALRRLAPLVRLAGSRGVVIGCGVMGLLNLAAARALGASEMIAVEPDPARRRVALRCGAAAALTPEEAGRTLVGAADFVVIGPGNSEVVRQSLAYVRAAGAACLFTPTPTGSQTGLDLGELYFREVSLVPSYSCGPDDTRLAYDLLRSGRVCTEGLVTHRFPLAAAQEAFDTARRGGEALKVLVTFEEDRV